jgi:DNA recombination protein RmuC
MGTTTVVIAMLVTVTIAGLVILVVHVLEASPRRTAETRLAEANAEREKLDLLLEAERKARGELDTQLALARERLDQASRRAEDFEKLRQESLNQAKAAVFETAKQVSNQLLDDHKRESEAAKKETEERVQKASAQLVEQVGAIAKAVAALDGQVQDKARTLDTVWRSLTSPGGAGAIAEIGLANTLKSFGLEEGRDFVLQITTSDAVTGERLRPDALVFLPGASAIVIDCKASKFLVEIAAAQGEEAERAAYANLAMTMNRHLKALDDKNYRGAVQTAWRQAGRGDEIARIVSIMYLPNEAALEKLCLADPQFRRNAQQAGIIPAGPTGLHCALSLAAIEITGQRQAENQQRILDATQALVDGVAIALSHAAAVGKGIKAAAESFQKLTSSVNQRLLPRARRLGMLGVAAGKSLPPNLPAYNVVSHESDHLIEAEAAEIDEPPAPRLIAE